MLRVCVAERGTRISPLASATKHGVRWGLHSDAPVTPPNPLKSIWTAVTRKTRTSQILGPEQRVNAEEVGLTSTVTLSVI